MWEREERRERDRELGGESLTYLAYALGSLFIETFSFCINPTKFSFVFMPLFSFGPTMCDPLGPTYAPVLKEVMFICDKNLYRIREK